MTAASDFVGAQWFKSSFSGANNGQCVEVAFWPGQVGVRDSKQRGTGPVHAFPAAEWAAFLAAVRTGQFDRLG
jgi:hypothetical protein